MNGRRQRGFSLLEVVIAIAVLAFAMAALVEGAGRGAFNANHLKEKTLAHWVGLNKIAEYQLQPTWPTVGVQKGTYDMAGFDWRWEARVTATEDRNVHRLEMEVRTGPGSKQAITKLTAFLDNPASVGAAVAPAGGAGGPQGSNSPAKPGNSGQKPAGTSSSTSSPPRENAGTNEEP